MACFETSSAFAAGLAPPSSADQPSAPQQALTQVATKESRHRYSATELGILESPFET
jgi:hypothetical protein